ncbi:MAG: hypothetical protein HZB51_26340 [Chloroflexi bacterium]|nr:hypothetical protein [Chloroflexota bacterium]
MEDESGETVLKGILKCTDRPVQGFISLDGYQGAPGYQVRDDGRFLFEIPIAVAQQLHELNDGPNHRLYVFKTGGGSIVIPIELVENSESEISIDFDSNKYEINIRRYE